MKLIKQFKELNKNDVGIAGGKGSSLGELIKNKIQVPPGFVLLTSAFENFLNQAKILSSIDSILKKINHNDTQAMDQASATIQGLILAQAIPLDITNEVKKEFKKLKTKYVAVRSSATAEDSIIVAWAGQLDSYLNTTEDTLLDNIKKCWASLYTSRAIFYRLENNLSQQKISVAVIVQKMIESELSGVVFSVNPLNNNKNQLIIEASYGLGEAVVSGQVTPDNYIVEKEPLSVMKKNIHLQTRGLYRGKISGNEWKDISPEIGSRQVLNDGQILELAKIIVEIEKKSKFPCDIEWAYEDKKFFILQNRPITTLPQKVLLDNEAKKIVKISTREAPVLFIELGSISQTVLLAKEIGKGFSTLIVHFDGKILTSYRVENELAEIIKLSWQYLLDSDLTDLMHQLDNRIIKFNKALEKKKEIIDMVKELTNIYLFSVIVFFATNIEMNEVQTKKYPEIIKYCEQVRAKVDRVVEETMKKIQELIDQGIITKFTSLDDLRHGRKETQGASKGFIFAYSKLHFMPLNEFNKKYNFVYEEEKYDHDNFSKIKGQSVYPGKIKGIARIIRSIVDLKKMKIGDIMVTPMTMPTFISGVKKAAAIVTDEGGVTCHASIIAREMKKPCIIATIIATKVIKDGDVLTIDAGTGMVSINN